MAYRLLHKKSSVLGKKPTKDQLEYGELAINYAVNGETISIRNSNDEIVSFINEKEVDLKIANLVSGAPETLDTIYELASALTENQDVVEVLQQSITNKQDELISGLNIKTINNESLLGNGNINLNLNNYYTKEEIDNIKNTINNIIIENQEITTNSLTDLATSVEQQGTKLIDNEKKTASALTQFDNDIKNLTHIVNDNKTIAENAVNELQKQINQYVILINQLQKEIEILKQYHYNATVTETTLNINGVVEDSTLEITNGDVDITNHLLIF